MSIRKIGTVPGYGADRHTQREAFYSSSSFVRYDTQNPHITIPGYKFEHKKKQVDVVIDMRSAMTAGCDFWLGEQGATMCPQSVPAMAIMAIRTVGGGALSPPKLNWKYPESVKLPAPRSQYE
eukprot:5679511-Pyramimonas_sp.AAC.1